VTRVAGIDCGTNTIRLLIADVGPDGRVVDVERRMEFVRLGEGVDATGELAPAAIGRTLATAADYAAACRAAGVERVRFVATSASRDARNAGEFVAGVRRVLGVEPEVISGAEEAGLSFTGAVRGLVDSTADPAPYLVVDIGGGSTEFVLGQQQVEAACSVDVGSVRLTERYFRADPPAPDELARACADVEDGLARAAAEVPLGRAATLIGVAGTVTTLAAHALGLSALEEGMVHQARLPVADVLAACDDLLGLSRAQRLALPYMPAGRVDVIGAGALIWAAVVARVAQAAGVGSVVVSEYDILDGIVLGLAGSGSAGPSARLIRTAPTGVAARDARPAMGYGLGVVVDPESPL
jgi:exopolyphosphatase/guanosine-5'-triphosphate,3'-diphosphate pyrophosphatase